MSKKYSFPLAVLPRSKTRTGGSALRMLIWAIGILVGAIIGFFFALIVNGANGDFAPSTIKSAMITLIVIGTLLGFLVAEILVKQIKK